MQTAELGNGMKVCAIPDKRFPIVLHILVYKVGGMDDPPGFSGVAHFLEHMMFTGTEKVQDFSEKINGLGGKLNAVTSGAYTAYYELIGKQHLPLVMAMEADRMHSLKLTPEYFERERNVVLEERKMRTEGHPRGLLNEEALNVFYRNGYGRPVVGWEHEIANYNMEVVESFYRKYYNPNNAILLVVGDVDFEEVMKLAHTHYGEIKNISEVTEQRSDLKLEPPHRTDITIKMKSSTALDSEIFMLYKTPNFAANGDLRGYYAAFLAADVVSGDEFGVLHDELVRKQSIATHVSATYGAQELSHGAISIDVSLRPGVSAEVASKEIKRVIAELMEHGVSEEAVKNARYRKMAHVVYDLDSIEDRAWFYAGLLATGSDVIAMEDVVNMIEGIKVEDVNDAIKAIFVNPAVESHLLPKL
ncbi:MAG: M16 family metallopeptidase [Anaplasma sp.]